ELMLDSDSPEVRIHSAQAYSFLCIDERSCVGRLLALATNDKDVSVRRSCIGVLGVYSLSRPMSADMKSKLQTDLEGIASDDPAEIVRKEALRVLRSIAK